MGNSVSIRQRNQLEVKRLLQTYPGINRHELAGALSLSVQAVNRHVNRIRAEQPALKTMRK